MIGVIIKQDGKIVSKDVYAGDDEEIMKIIEQKKDEYKDLTFEVYRDTDDDWKTVFESAISEVKENSDWKREKQKGISFAVDFIAKKLGLE